MHNHFHLSREQKRHLLEAIERFPHRRILVVGDLMLDLFIWGEVRRISPEAPVPVVEVCEESRLLGGTANVVHNVASLGGQVLVTGIIGDDGPGEELMQLLRSIHVPTEGLVVETGRPTTIKTRIIAQNQQVVRFDRECRIPLRRESVGDILSHIAGNLENIDGIIVSDYAKGVVTPEFMDALRSLTATCRFPVIVDPKVQHTELYRHFTMITPNHHEASRMSGIEIRDEKSLVEAGRILLKRLQCKTVLITRGKEGMSLFHQDGEVFHIPTVARRVFDVTGAGDTVIATLALGIVAGLSMVEAALLANLAAGIVVGEVGTTAVAASQLFQTVEKAQSE
ncbi:D-glycero-beta-D-manno-heptose-7-phosphate kinase [Desulforhabdus amnigena]|uniref:RfaE bifunctional protein, domain I n=1 Tax=Desulforhabdus amnigena TaxID=40218 RepID=A0A9W6D6R3_9BACT|nr:D-glycero-beta-D-manno-heptose-7-phosphate kinase [Desulforhabdus amnigena]NLJ27829.1 D-glycero-beta-D-manno-heptose-7-phosphate kinase [Deltaproteobacteria bacterium]GLI34796.1 RfaE bifunctional protein, domain I [Desulforhabdus amnigena]